MITRGERINSLDDAVLSALQAWQGAMWTAMPAVITKITNDFNTLECVPTIQARFTQPDASKEWKDMPLLVDCPILFPGGGGFCLTFPLVPGDEVLVIFSSRCIDAWWQAGAGASEPYGQRQMELRMHDLSDGFAIPSPRSLPKAIPNVSTTSVQLRNEDLTSFVEIDDVGHITVYTEHNLIGSVTGTATLTVNGNTEINVLGSSDLTATVGGDAAVLATNITGTATGEIDLAAPTIKLTGNVQISGGTLTHNGVNVGSTHKHSGVVSGGSQTGNPI